MLALKIIFFPVLWIGILVKTIFQSWLINSSNISLYGADKVWATLSFISMVGILYVISLFIDPPFSDELQTDTMDEVPAKVEGNNSTE